MNIEKRPRGSQKEAQLLIKHFIASIVIRHYRLIQRLRIIILANIN